MRSPSCNVVPGQLGGFNQWKLHDDQRYKRASRRAVNLVGSRNVSATQDDLEDGCSEATHGLLIAISFFGRLVDVIEVKKVLEGPKGRHCLGFMARCFSLNVPHLPND
ncbi:unnamed protein product [Caenorhabditis nigoni]